MDTRNDTYLKPFGSLQLIAIIAVVIGHFAVKEPAFINSHWVSFCFVYSGLFTAIRHRFGQDYGLRDHFHFMGDKLAKLYPLHLLALALGLFDAWLVWGNSTINLKVLFSQLTLTSPWIHDPDYYFAINPVAWFCCDLFFLYLTAPLVVKLLRLMSISWQIALIIALLTLEFAAGFSPADGSRTPILGMYHLYQFPPIRLLDYGTGIILYNITREPWWNRARKRLTAATATTIEIGGIAAFVLLYMIEEAHLFGYCYRAYCVMAPGIAVLLATFLLTSGMGGLVSSILSLSSLTLLKKTGAEIYLLQFGVYFMLWPVFNHLGLERYDMRQFIPYLAVLLAVSWLVHRYYVLPAGRWLKSVRDRLP